MPIVSSKDGSIKVVQVTEEGDPIYDSKGNYTFIDGVNPDTLQGRTFKKFLEDGTKLRGRVEGAFNRHLDVAPAGVTLLRLLLPLSSRIRVTFHGHSIGSPIGRPQSENLTLALNR